MVYEPLNETSNEIRVLEIKPAKEVEDVVECRIEHVSLDAIAARYRRHGLKQKDWIDCFTATVDSREERLSPWRYGRRLPARQIASEDVSGSRYEWGDFEALSYTWGDQTPCRTIILNGNIVQAPENLEAALRVLRNLPETNLGMKYWVDALCIDQSNTVERNHQVKRMKDIYGNARAVVAWLGPHSPTDNQAISVIRFISRQACRSGGYEIWICSSFGSNDWRALHDFMKRQYWDRVWIIQELAVNHHATLILCGQKALSRTMIRDAVSYCATYADVIGSIIEAGPHAVGRLHAPLSFWSTARKLDRLIRLTNHADVGSGQDTLLEFARKSAAADPRDKIYGLLGLFEPTISSQIKPDYRLTERQVCVRFAKALMKASGSLDFLFYWTAPTLPVAWPSWLPRWSIPHDRHYLEYVKHRISKRDCACTSRFTYVFFERILLCRGFKLDIVDGVSASLSESNYLVQSQTRPKYQAAKLLNKSRKPSDDLSSLLWRTMLVDHHYCEKDITVLDIPWTPTMPETFVSEMGRRPFNQGMYTRFHRFREANANFEILGKRFKDFFSSETPSSGALYELEYNLNLTLTALAGRRIITTANGLLGLAPEATRQGDILAIIQGCSFPVILRPHHQFFKVVGECYVHGIKHEKLPDLLARGKISHRCLMLC